MSGRQTRTGEDSAHARGPDRPAGFRHRVRSSRWQRCRPLGRRSHPQAAARAGPGVRRALGVATHDLAIRERRAPHRALPDGARVGRERHRAASAPPARAGAADHDRSGPDRRPVRAVGPGSVVRRGGATEQPGLERRVIQLRRRRPAQPSLGRPLQIQRNRAHADRAGLGYRPVGQPSLVLRRRTSRTFLTSSLRAGIASPSFPEGQACGDQATDER